jgi:type IV pilus assembly protein PilY1
MQSHRTLALSLLTALTFVAGLASPQPAAAQSLSIAQSPLFNTFQVPPLNMLVVGRDHKLYYEAYNDTSDLNGDGVLDVGYKPNTIDYFGYFNSRICYTHDGDKFLPAGTAGGTNGKQCSGNWSGDFLNYLATSRMDALRKVLYGGLRSTDTATETVLQAAYITQDGHSWGKEYQSVARDGYDIGLYSPLSAPGTDRYNLFAVTTTASDGRAPVLRVQANTPYRVWEWVSIEGPVAGNRCVHGSTGPQCSAATAQEPFPGHPRSRVQFDALELEYATAANQFGAAVTNNSINCTNNACNPNGADDNYLTIATAAIRVTNDGNYQFRIDGDDNIDFAIYSNSGLTSLVTNGSVGCYPNGRGFGDSPDCTGTGATTRTTSNVFLATNQTYYIKFRHEEEAGGDGYTLEWQKVDNGQTFGWQILNTSSNSNNNINPSFDTATTARFRTFYYNLRPAVTGSAAIVNYRLRVRACPPENAAWREDNCKAYGSGATASYKPTGILHDYGESERMEFGLITGSQFNNTQGGVLRSEVKRFTSEINSNGTFTLGAGSIIRTLNSFRLIGLNYNNGDGEGTSNPNWSSGGDCAALGTAALGNGQCRMWGNPIGEMMYESLRYFAGAGVATPVFAAGGSATGVTEETTLGLPTATWKNPYAPIASGGQGKLTCARPYQTVISDINPSYDSALPGNAFGETAPNGATPATISGFSASTEGQTIWTQEYGGARSVYIGQAGAVNDGAPTAKLASSFGNIRGLVPEEPTKGGSYYSGSVARYGRVNDINAVDAVQNLRTYSVAVASPLPRIEIPVGTSKISLVPFAKSVGGAFGITAGAAFQPTNTIVDFYVERIVNLPGQPVDASINGGRGFAVFRINYEDVEQGNDHDMDAIVRYEIAVNADGTVSVTLRSEYAAGSVIQHMGYVISGTTNDGIYLDVRDIDTTAANSPAYRFNTPPGRNPGYCNVTTMPADCAQLPLINSRTFTAGGTQAAEVLKDPLWYAAKYGGFRDANDDGIPQAAEWDADADGVPDSYFLVTNALRLRDQLSNAFDTIAQDAKPSGSVTVLGARVSEGSLSFAPTYSVDAGGSDWTGDLIAANVSSSGGAGAQEWSASARMPLEAARNIIGVKTFGTSTTRVPVPFTAAGFGDDTAQRAAIGATAANISGTFGSTTTPAQVISYLRGNVAGEGNPFRNRSSILGDIINSRPTVSGNKDDYGWANLPGGLGTGYTAFVAGKASRTPAVYVGANDGFLHAFNAKRLADGGGVELFAFSPFGVRDNLWRLADPEYGTLDTNGHQYFVDGEVNVIDAKLGSSWATVLVGTAGRGGKTLFGLNVTAPQSFTANDVLWEVVGGSAAPYNLNMGQASGRPEIVLAEDNKWYALVGNGYNSAAGDPALMVVDLQTGATVNTIVINDGGTFTNGLGNIAVQDVNGNGKADTVYGGDLQGNLWKIDMTSVSPASWGVAYSGAPVFIARDALNVRQPITGGLELIRLPSGGTMVYFGTGRYLTDTDADPATSNQIQAFYAVLDKGTPSLVRSNLQQQTITAQNSGTQVTRSTSANPVDYSTQFGWYLDLTVNAAPGIGERFIGTPRIQSGVVLFTTFQPKDDPCSPGGDNFLYGLSALSGANALNQLTVGIPGVPACPTGDCGGLQIGDGAPVTETGVVLPAPPCRPGVDAGCSVPVPCDPADTSCIAPDETLLPTQPGGTGAGSRCNVVIRVEGTDPLILPRPCGRQSWRQIR